MSSGPPDPVQRIRELEAETGRQRKEIERLQAMLGLRVASAGPAIAQPASSAPTAPVRALRILLADDHPIQSKMTHALLDSLGYAADVVRNGQEVLYALEKKTYDVVLMDVQMPVMNGFETTAAIRERWPAGKRPRIIALTGRNLERDRTDCLAAGMDDFIGKPVSLRILAAKLAGRSESLVDAKTFEELAEATGKDTINELVEMFLRNVPRAIKSMREATAAGDHKELRNLAHPQVSVCHALGVLSMSLLAKQLETLGESAQLGAAPQVLDDFEGLLAPVEAELRRLQGGEAAAPQPAAVSAPRILVVEDNPVNLKIALSLLELLGHRADTAGSGLAAIRALEQHRYDVVLMDILLPIMDGLTATRQICARWPREQRPRIIAMTGLDTDADRQACMEAGMDDYVSKPLTRRVLADKLAQFGFRVTEAVPHSSSASDTAPTIVPQPDSMLVDAQVLRQWAQSNRKVAVDIIDEFLKSLRAMLADLRRTADSDDAKGFHRTAHSLKSASVAVGAVAMATLAAELEALGRVGAIQGTGEAVSRLEAMRAPLEEKLQELRKLYA